MIIKKTTAFAIIFSPLIMSYNSQAFDVVEAGQPILTGEPSRVGPPSNHRSTFNIPGTKTDVAFGGYIKLDMLYDFDYDFGKSITPFNLLNPENKKNGNTQFTAAESRLNFRTHTQTEYGNITTFLEGHFMPDEKFNLRHAYGEINGFLAGKTWSNFMSFVGSPTTLPLGSPKGYSFDRNPQLRYSKSIGDGYLSVSLEDSETVISRQSSSIAKAENKLPNFTLRYEYDRRLALSSVVRNISIHGKKPTVNDSKTKTGYGAQAQFSFPLSSSTKFKGNITYGSGIGNYMGNPGNSGHRNAPDVYVNSNGHLKLVDIKGFGVSLNHNWTHNWFSSIGYSRLDQDLPEIDDYKNNFKTIDQSYINVLWDVTDRLMVGLEYQYVDVKNNSNISMDGSRLQASAKFQF